MSWRIVSSLQMLVQRFLFWCVVIAVVHLYVPFSRSAAAQEVAKENLLLKNHPLVETIWDVKSGKQITQSQLWQALAKGHYVLLGEKHDNPRHHEIQAQAVGALVGAGKRPALVFEMLDETASPILAIARENELAQLGKELKWEARGWPAFSMYAPIFKQGLAAGLPLIAGGPSREKLKRVASGALPFEADKLLWDKALTTPLQQSLVDELVSSHCHLMKAEQMAPMVAMQRLKDASMARAMRETTPRQGAILIAGNGHIRVDRGVPYYLTGGGQFLTLAPVEVQRGAFKAQDYKMFDAKLYDYIWFTARVDEVDPCEKYKGSLQRLKSKGDLKTLNKAAEK
ncbi:ChaN family lipoprotein [Polycladidibacter stylochi]|uniref:ChaN family lipoprotein n=1 Tax=Polycladidibacter stylochi TaxID=1807766 RepID=UPI0008329558|nr:ChaN family lipoprotein [Pseudovibrio stylochi]